MKPTGSQVERAWPNGPLRKIGTGHGQPSKYVCERCHLSALSGVRRKDGHWLCGSCEEGVERRPRHVDLEKLAGMREKARAARYARQSLETDAKAGHPGGHSA